LHIVEAFNQTGPVRDLIMNKRKNEPVKNENRRVIKQRVKSGIYSLLDRDDKNPPNDLNQDRHAVKHL